jgi:hypothetical protein
MFYDSSFQILHYLFNLFVCYLSLFLRLIYFSRPLSLHSFEQPPELLGPNEKGLCYIAIKNISKAPFGSKHAYTNDAMKHVNLEVKFPSKYITPLANHTSNAESGDDFKAGKYTFRIQSNTTRSSFTGIVAAQPTKSNSTLVKVDILDLAPGATVVVVLPCRSTAITQKRLYYSFPISTTLALAKRPISRYKKEVRIVPVFDASKAYDVLLVTCNKIDHTEFQAW